MEIIRLVTRRAYLRWELKLGVPSHKFGLDQKNSELLEIGNRIHALADQHQIPWHVFRFEEENELNLDGFPENVGLAMKVQTLEKENRELRSALADAEAKQRYLEQDFEAVTGELEDSTTELGLTISQLQGELFTVREELEQTECDREVELHKLRQAQDELSTAYSMVEENHVELKQLRQTEDALVTATRRWVQIHFEDFSELLEKRVKAIETHLWEV